MKHWCLLGHVCLQNAGKFLTRKSLKPWLLHEIPGQFGLTQILTSMDFVDPTLSPQIDDSHTFMEFAVICRQEQMCL